MHTVLAGTVINYLQMAVVGFALSRTVPLRRPWLFCAVYPLFPVAMSLLCASVFPRGVVTDLLNICGCVLVPLLFSLERRTRTLLCTLVYMIATLFTELTATLMLGGTVERSGQPLAELARSDPSFLVTSKLLGLLILCLYTTAAYVFLSRWFQKGRLRSVSPLFLLVPLSQMLTMDLLLLTIQNSPAQAVDHWTLLLVAAVCIAADAAYFRAAGQLRQQEALREELALTERELKNQLSYYQQMEQDILTINQIRHDLNNQLRSVYALLESGESELARRQLDNLHDGLKNHVGTVYCANPIVDAVLTRKAELCRQQGIRLNVELELPSDLPVDGVHLCSIFGNLLDNAIDGCAASGQARPEITVTSFRKQEYLVIECVNTAAKTAPERERRSGAGLREHGLGLGILQRIAETYHGMLTARCQEGRFTAAVMLCLSPQPALISPVAAGEGRRS